MFIHVFFSSLCVAEIKNIIEESKQCGHLKKKICLYSFHICEDFLNNCVNQKNGLFSGKTYFTSTVLYFSFVNWRPGVKFKFAVCLAKHCIQQFNACKLTVNHVQESDNIHSIDVRNCTVD
jgi:hypothetical protein